MGAPPSISAPDSVSSIKHEPPSSVPDHNPASVGGKMASAMKQEPMDFDKPASVKQEQPSSHGPSSSLPGENGEIKTEIKDEKPVVKSETPQATVSKVPRKIFKPDELRQELMPTLEKLYRQDPESLPFRQPVDPQVLAIPDYFDIIKKPMDLSTIKRKLDTGQYKDPWEYCDDVWLMFDNAWLYNRKTSRVYKYCTKLAEVFEQEIDPVMMKLGYCCGRKYVYQPQVLCCFGKQLCAIQRDSKYWSYQNRYTYCAKCFEVSLPRIFRCCGQHIPHAIQVKQNHMRCLRGNSCCLITPTDDLTLRRCSWKPVRGHWRAPLEAVCIFWSRCDDTRVGFVA